LGNKVLLNESVLLFLYLLLKSVISRWDVTVNAIFKYLESQEHENFKLTYDISLKQKLDTFKDST